MNIPLLQLELCKVSNQLKALLDNSYSNSTLKEYQEKLFDLFDKLTKLIQEDLATNPNDYDLCLECLEFLSTSAEFLEGSVLNLIPYETMFCLEQALKDWTDERFTFVTSIQNSEYAFNPRLSIETESFYIALKSKFNIEFNNRLIQISIPKFEVNDYFFNVVLYHELGHFVDLHYQISESIVLEKYSNLNEDELRKKRCHIREHFADIFSAQYINECFKYFLEQRAENDGESETHPATSIRIEVIEAFIDSEKNETVDLINEAIQEITSKELKIRFSKPDSEDFFNYLPPVISRESELHGLFIVGWEIWLNNLDRFNEKDSRKKYLYLNNLIEKSISNFMIQKRWEDVCK